MRRLALPLLVALVAVGCKVSNLDYCPDATTNELYKSCSKYRAFVDANQERAEAGDARDAAVEASEAGDAVADATDAAEVKKPVCAVDGDCAADGGVNLACDTSGAEARCVECVEAKHCKDATRSVCDPKAHRCVQCLDDMKCGGTTPVCDTMAQRCVGCLQDLQCAGKTPICDATKKECRACAADAECKDPKICVESDGHCAAATEIVTLQGGAGCTPAGLTYCKSADAVNALAAGHAILLVQGPSPVGTIDLPAAAPATILILGRNNATVAAGAGDAAGLHLAGPHQVWVRELTVSGGTTGVVAEMGVELHLTRSAVTNNGKGGIRTANSSFEITNTIIANNMPGIDGTATFGGALLGDVPAGGMARFEHNTVVDNKAVGVACSPARDMSTSIVHGNLVKDIVNCSGAICCGATDPDPKLTATYHLMSGSPCLDVITATTTSLKVDVDGMARPAPPAGKLDCGADELVP